jgi:integrase/recombinase XerC
VDDELSAAELTEQLTEAATRVVFSWDSGTANGHALHFVQWMQKKGNAPNTINVRLSALKSLVRLGRMLGVVSWTLDVRGVRAEKVKDTRGPNAETVQRVLDAAQALGPRAYAMALLMFERGLRNIEVRELKMEHLKLDELTIMVRGKGKQGLNRLTVSAEVVKALREWLQRRDVLALGKVQRRPASRVAVEPVLTGFVFCPHGKTDQPLTSWDVWDLTRKTGLGAGIKLWPHALRHAAITAALDASDGNVREVQKFSRHKDINTVLVYDDERRDVGGEMTRKLSELRRKK